MLRNELYVYGSNDLTVPAMFNSEQYTLQKFISYKDDVALLDADTKESKTYRELAQRVVDVALSLTHRGIGGGDVVAYSTVKWNYVMFEGITMRLGIQLSGAVLTVMPTEGSAIVLHSLKISKPKVMICSREVFDSWKDIFDAAGCIELYVIDGEEKVEGAILFKEFFTETGRVEDFIATPIALPGASLLSCISYSSGTTGLPKGIPMYDRPAFGRLFFATSCENYRGKRALLTYPYTSFVRECMIGGVTLIYTKSLKPENFLKIIEEYKVDVTMMMPNGLIELSKSPELDNYNVSSLRLILTGVSTFGAEQFRFVKRRMPTPRICQIYGTSETWLLCRDEDAPLGSKPGSVGCAVPGVILKVVDVVTREPLGPNQQGEICARSLAMFKGYIGDDTDKPYMDEEGFFMTGDLGYYDEDQYFYIVDRIKDIIKCDYTTVSPSFLESLLLPHPSVSEAGVVGAPHDKYGEVPVAFVVLQPGADVTEQELVDYVDGQVGGNMQLRGGVRFVDFLPRGRLGKLDKKALRSMLPSYAYA